VLCSAGMFRVASVVLFSATALTAWGAPRGRVVRVERQRGGTAAVPVLCEVKTDGSGICVGPAPQVGDSITVVDDTHTIAEVRITRIQAMAPQCNTLWSFSGEATRGDLSQSKSSKTIGVIDPGIDRRLAHRVDEDHIESPTPGPEVRVLLGVDRDGDGTADMIVTQFNCDKQGQPTSSSSAVDFCIDIWSERDAVMKRAWSTKLQSCR